MKRLALSFVVALFLAIPAAHATPLVWTFDDTSFANHDGGVVSGSFTFDPDTNSISNIDFASTAGSSFAGATYMATDTSYPPSSGALFFYTATLTTGSPIFFLQPDNPLTDAGGAQHFTDAEYECENAACSFLDTLRTGDGYISTLSDGVGVAETPEPAASITLLCLDIASTSLTRF